MRKNIIILGTGRVGKTTLAKKLNEQLNYSVIGTDDIITAFERAMPQANIGLPNDIETTVANLTPFLAHFIGGLTYRSCCPNGTNFVLEGSGSHFDFEKMQPILDMYDEWKDNYLLVGLIYPNISPDDLINDIRKHDNQNDWTYNLSDSELRSHVINGIEYSKNFHAIFQKYNPIIYDVSKNRNDVLDKIVADIKLT
ncbi:MAG: hypothetical protein FWC16_08625 [Defluviitaleaceae bacterium]|nr:hypothetical protein [Defluviitaleaceae bacterium]MCL2274975.1 hypothetical protein [Defluviitaleaceae bacterium]